MEKVSFQLDDETVVEFYVEEQTRVGGTDYLLVADSLEEEATAYILKDISGGSDEMAEYVMVEDDDELQALSKVFQEMLDDTDIYL